MAKGVSASLLPHRATTLLFVAAVHGMFNFHACCLPQCDNFDLRPVLSPQGNFVPPEFPLDPIEKAAVDLFNAGKLEEAFDMLNLTEDAARASFIFRTPGIDTTILGELLGAPENEPFTHTYVKKLDLRGLSLDVALRRLLSG